MIVFLIEPAKTQQKQPAHTATHTHTHRHGEREPAGKAL